MSESFFYKFDPSKITVSTGDKTDKSADISFFIQNNGEDILVLDNPNKITINEMPDISDETISPMPGFYLYFNYGDKAADLTEEKDAGSIAVSLQDSPALDIQKRNGDTSRKEPLVYWIVCPKEKTILENKDCIILEISNIICNAKRGIPTAYIGLRLDKKPEFKEINTLTKIPKPKIAGFSHKNCDYENGGPMVLAWEVHDTSCVYLDDIKIRGNEKEVKAENKIYVLEAENDVKYSVSAAYEPWFRFIEIYRLEEHENTRTIELVWKVKNAEKISIDGIAEDLANEGSYSLKAPRERAVYTLRAVCKLKDNTTQEYTRTLVYLKPEITEFDAVIVEKQTMDFQPGLDGNADGFISLEEISLNPVIPVASSTYDGPQPIDVKVSIKWKTLNAEYCTIAKQSVKQAASGNQVFNISLIQKKGQGVELKAVSSSGHYVTQFKSLYN